MKKKVVFPYTLENSSLCKMYLNKKNGYIISSLCGTVTINKSIGETLSREEDDSKIVDINSIDFNEIDEFIIIESKNLELYKPVDNIINICKTKGIKIKSFSCEYLTYSPKVFEEKYNFDIDNYISYEFIETPVVFVGGIKDVSENSWVSVKIHNELKKHSINSIVISEYIYSTELDIYPYPKKFFQNQISSESKVLLLNQYINHLVKTINPDLIIIELPGGPLRYDDYIYNYFGIYYYIVSQAVSGDVYICTVPIGEYTDDYFTKLNKYILNKFDMSIDAIHLSNINFENQLDKSLGNDDDYYYVSSQTLLKYLEINKTINIVAFGSIYENQYLEHIVTYIIDKLRG